MILITQVDDWEVQFTTSTDFKWKQDKDLYSKFIQIYEINFEKYLASIKKLDVIKEGRKVTLLLEENEHSKYERKLRTEFEKIRPYFYYYNDKFYFFRSPLLAFQEANIFQLEQNDIIQVLEKSLLGTSFVEKIKRKFCKIMFINDLNFLNKENI